MKEWNRSNERKEWNRSNERKEWNTASSMSARNEMQQWVQHNKQWAQGLQANASLNARNATQQWAQGMQCSKLKRAMNESNERKERTQRKSATNELAQWPQFLECSNEQCINVCSIEQKKCKYTTNTAKEFRYCFFLNRGNLTARFIPRGMSQTCSTNKHFRRLRHYIGSQGTKVLDDQQVDDSLRRWVDIAITIFSKI